MLDGFFEVGGAVLGAIGSPRIMLGGWILEAKGTSPHHYLLLEGAF